MAKYPNEVECVGQAAGCWLQEGVADVEGGMFASSRSIVAERAAVIVHAEAVPTDAVARSTRGCASADEKSGLRQTIGLGFPSWLSSQPLPTIQAVKEANSGMNSDGRGRVWGVP
ncbi:hypothetical protein [Candidatus Methylacidithermus pantelleriae]|uniref:Uncharacterized protein n=1 Tax=Candidatus Methylacidithermus pantelleriae TaxID=2744239 RepID=A0A8J2BHY2_9BACT|nr:hypothetical protein [Candidatus Methylacidithermus pantelleriae]CAF0696112.1 hypothetical protein MPNT_20119 [Candidatus Methylacidithermus pantelleriae]